MDKVLMQRVIDALNNLVEDSDCVWDHNHSCQEHMYFFIPQGEMCPMEEAKQLIITLESQENT